MSSGSLFSTTWNDASESDVSYSRVSVTALIALFFGLASFLVFMSVWFCFLGILGILLSLAAVGMIRRGDGTLTGLTPAYSGLCLSIVSLVAVSVLWPTYHYGVRKEADRFFRIWFEALRNDNIPMARGLASPYWERPNVPDPNDEEARKEWWTDNYENIHAHRSIHQYTDDKLVRILLALGEKATVTYYKTTAVTTDDDKDTVEALYAVSYPGEDGKTRTFFVRMTGNRRFPKGDVKSAGWSLVKNPEFVLPEEFKN